MGIVELFAGIGCVARGFNATGYYETVALTDINDAARATYLANYPDFEDSYLLQNVVDLRPEALLEVANGRSIAGVLGCPPCQGFSSAGTRDATDERNKLVKHYFRIVKALEPRFLVMENVPQVLNYSLFQSLIAELEQTYVFWKGVLNSALYGVPQTRQRAIVIGYRRDLGVSPTVPRITHLGEKEIYEYSSKKLLSPSSAEGANLLGIYPCVGRSDDFWKEAIQPQLEGGAALADLVTVGEAIGDLPDAGSGDKSAEKTDKPRHATGLIARNGAVHNHRRWRHRQATIDRLKNVAEGGGLYCHTALSDRPYFSQAYTRLHRQGLARTITTNFHNPGSGRFLHYEQTRTLTVREAARLQSISDSFRFVLDSTTQERLVGNAFPERWASAIARHIHAEIGESR